MIRSAGEICVGCPWICVEIWQVIRVGLRKEPALNLTGYCETFKAFTFYPKSKWGSLQSSGVNGVLTNSLTDRTSRLIHQHTDGWDQTGFGQCASYCSQTAVLRWTPLSCFESDNTNYGNLLGVTLGTPSKKKKNTAPLYVCWFCIYGSRQTLVNTQEKERWLATVDSHPSCHYFLNGPVYTTAWTLPVAAQPIIPPGLLLRWEVCCRSPLLRVVIFIAGDVLATCTHLSPSPQLSPCTVIIKGVGQAPRCDGCPRTGGRKCWLECGLFLCLSHDFGESCELWLKFPQLWNEHSRAPALSIQRWCGDHSGSWDSDLWSYTERWAFASTVDKDGVITGPVNKDRVITGLCIPFWKSLRRTRGLLTF